MEFTESNLKFVFDDSHWELITQFDKETDYLKVCRAVKETKSVDFIGVNNNGTTYLFEIKNFKGHERDQEVRDRLGCNAEELMTEISQKVRDTLPCLLAGARNSTHKADSWKKISSNIMDNSHRLMVVAWIEQLIDSGSEAEKKSKLSMQRSKLKQKLSWLTGRVDIQCYSNNTIEGLVVSLLPE